MVTTTTTTTRAVRPRAPPALRSSADLRLPPTLGFAEAEAARTEVLRMNRQERSR